MNVVERLAEIKKLPNSREQLKAIRELEGEWRKEVYESNQKNPIV